MAAYVWDYAHGMQLMRYFWDAAVVQGVVLAIVMLKMIWSVVSRAVDNGLDWLILTFGSEHAARQIEEKWATRGNP